MSSVRVEKKYVHLYYDYDTCKIIAVKSVKKLVLQLDFIKPVYQLMLKTNIWGKHCSVLATSCTAILQKKSYKSVSCAYCDPRGRNPKLVNVIVFRSVSRV